MPTTQATLARDRVAPAHVSFLSPVDGERRFQVKMDRGTWEELDKPATIRVSIEVA